MTETPRCVCILGATSAIGEATARMLAARGDRIALVGRQAPRLEAIASDLTIRGAGRAVIRCQDLEIISDPVEMFDAIAKSLGGLDAVLMFQGVLGEQVVEAFDMQSARQILAVNFTSAALLSLAAADRLVLSEAAAPVLISIGSVAGDRGRASNFVYGAAKGGLAILYQGLHHRSARKGSVLRTVVIKAGFVDTPMTATFEKGGLLWSRPEAIASVVVSAMDKGGPILYAPWFWRWIMLIIRLLPQAVMDRLSL